MVASGRPRAVRRVAQWMTVQDGGRNGDPDGWRRLSADLGRWARGLTGLTDLAVDVGPGTGAPGRYEPGRTAIVLDPLVLGVGDPARVVLDTARGRAEHAALIGTLVHCCAHARHTDPGLLWDGVARPDPARFWALQAEESRAEGALLRSRPDLAVYLRAAAGTVTAGGRIDVPGHEESGPGDRGEVFAACRAAVLVLARAEVGVLGPGDVAAARRAALDALGEELLGRFRETWRAAQRLADGDVAGLLDCGRRFADLVDEAARRRPEGGPPPRTGRSEDGEDGEPAGVAAARDERADRAAERDRRRQRAAEVFGEAPAEDAVDRRPIWVTSQRPGERELRWARTLAAELDRAGYRDVARSRVRRPVPPGRLDRREAARRDAQRDLGLRVTARPWSAVRRRIVDRPPLTVGIAVDVSGSMDAWARPASVLAWALARAVRGRSGTVAAVAFAGHAQVLIPADTAPENVPVASCGGGSTGLPAALEALDGELGLSDACGARALVVVTDGDLPNADRAAALAGSLAARGVTVLWAIGGERSVGAPAGAAEVRLDTPGTAPALLGRAVAGVLGRA